MKKRKPNNLHIIKDVQTMMLDSIIGSVQLKENASITKKGKRLLDEPTVGMAKALMNIKFHWKFLIGIVGRKENGTPYCEYEFVTLSHHAKLFDSKVSTIIFDELKDKFNKANHQTRLTTFWIASPNLNQDDSSMLAIFYSLMNKYRVFDNMITQHEISNNIEPSRTLHTTDYWYSLCEMYEVTYETVPKE